MLNEVKNDSSANAGNTTNAINGANANGANSNAQNATATAAFMNAVSIKLQPFLKDHPELWFTQVENQFQARGIVADDTKYWHVSSSLSPDVALEVWDIIGSPPAVNKYQALKDALIARTAISERDKIQQLLSTETLGDQRPSNMLRKMQQLISNRQVDDALLRQLFLQRLPANIQQILAAVNAPTVNDLAVFADQIFEVKDSNAPAVPQVCAVDSKPTPDPAQAILINAISDLTKQIAELKSEFHHQQRQSRRQTPARGRGRSNSRKRSETRNRDYCWYHNKFGDKARRCSSPPCNYSPRGNDNGRH